MVTYCSCFKIYTYIYIVLVCSKHYKHLFFSSLPLHHSPSYILPTSITRNLFKIFIFCIYIKFVTALCRWCFKQTFFLTNQKQAIQHGPEVIWMLIWLGKLFFRASYFLSLSGKLLSIYFRSLTCL